MNAATKQYKGATCKGSYILGSACGKCERCTEERLRLSTRPAAATASAIAPTPAISTPGLSIERSRDYSLLWRIATSEEIYRITSDDGSPIPSRWRIAEREDCMYLLAQLDGKILGFVAFYPLNAVTFEAHLCFLSRGPVNELCFRKMLQWMWTHTKARRIIGAIPEYNFLAIAFAKRCGFEKFGWNRDSWLKNGKLYAQVCMGISRPSESRLNS